MYRVLAFGDSNTWGYIPGSAHLRYDENSRWPKVANYELGNGFFEVVEEGLNSRTISSEDSRPGKVGRSSVSYIVPCLDSHDPLDFVVVMLGTNELKAEYRMSSDQIFSQMESLVTTIATRRSQSSNKTAQVVLVSPPYIDESKPYAASRFSNTKPVIDELSKRLGQLSVSQDYLFVDGRGFKTGEDGVHLTQEAHKKLGRTVYKTLWNVVYDSNRYFLGGF